MDNQQLRRIMYNQIDLLKKLQIKFQNEANNIEILKFSGMKTQAVFQCKKCGQTFSIQPHSLLTRKSTCFCAHCSSFKVGSKATIENKKRIIEMLKKTPHLHFISFDYSEEKHRRISVKYYCDICGEISSIKLANLKNDYLTCKHCGKGSHQSLADFKKWLSLNYDNKFILLNDSEYNNHNTRLHIKCADCGFIFYPSITSLKRSRKALCPKCRSNKSRGEIYIAEFLAKQNIEFFTEWNFDWLPDKRLRYDFFLPEYKILIEFDGLQHFEWSTYFGSETKFKQLQNNDKLKNQLAIQNGFSILRIPYNYENKIKIILHNLLSSTTISTESRGKFLEVDNFLYQEEDLV